MQQEKNKKQKKQNTLKCAQNNINLDILVLRLP